MLSLKSPQARRQAIIGKAWAVDVAAFRTVGFGDSCTSGFRNYPYSCRGYKMAGNDSVRKWPKPLILNPEMQPYKPKAFKKYTPKTIGDWSRW